MRPAALVHFYRVRLRARLVADLLAVAGIAVGVALIFAALVASTSLTGSVRELTRGLVGDATLQLAARGPGGFDQRLLRKVERMDGVRSVAPVAETRANLVRSGEVRSVLLLGGDPRFARFGGRLFRHLDVAEGSGRPGVVLPAPLASDLGLEPGERVTVETGSGVGRVPVVGELRTAQVGSLVESPVALAPLQIVQAVGGLRGRLSRIFVSPLPGREGEVREALERIAAHRLDVAPADHEVTVFERASYPTNRSTALFSVLSALVGFLFALSAMLLTVPQRRRLISELRLAGYESWVVVEILLFDALVLGACGSILGLVLGDGVSRHLFQTVPDYLTFAFPVGSQRIVTWQSIAVACAAGVAAACIAVLAPVRSALSPDPGPSEEGAATLSRNAMLAGSGVACLALAGVIALLAPNLALLGIGALTAALVLLLPAWLRRTVSGIDRIGRRSRSPVAILAVLELASGSGRIRTLALAATGAIAVFATVSIGGANADLQRGLDRASREVNQRDDVWITFRGSANLLGTTPFAPAPRQTAAIEQLPGVRSVRAYGGGFLDVGDNRVWVIAPPRSAGSLVGEGQIRDGTASIADRRLRAGGWLVLSEAVAEELGVGVGERVTLPSPRPAVFRVAALSNNNGWAGGAIVMNATEFARAWSTRAVAALGVGTEPGASPAAVAQAVRGALGPRSRVVVETGAERLRRHEASSRAGLARLSQIATLVLVATVLAMAVAAGGVIWQRRPMIAALKVHGFEELALWRALLLESGLLLGTGCLAGACFGLAGQILFDQGLTAITGFPIFYRAAWGTAIAVLAVVTGTALAMLAIPGWLAVRVRPSAGLPD